MYLERSHISRQGFVEHINKQCEWMEENDLTALRIDADFSNETFYCTIQYEKKKIDEEQFVLRK